MQAISNESRIIRNTFSWMFGVIFIAVGILNLIFVHPVPGIFYLLFSLLFLPPVNDLFKRKLGFAIPMVVRVIIFLVIMWGTLAVGDLAEMAGL